MRAHSTGRSKPGRIGPAFVVTNSGASEPGSASVHLLNSPAGPVWHQHSVHGTQMPAAWRNETAELLADIDGLPILVRLRLSDVPAEVRSDLVSGGTDIHARLSSMLEKMVSRINGASVRRELTSGPPLAAVKLISSEDPLVRPRAPSNETVLRVGSLELDLLDRTAKRGDRQIDLRPREFRLLKYMMQRHDDLLTRATLLKEVWRYRFVPETNLVDVHMGRLRRKIDGPNDPPLVRCVRGVGFVLGTTPWWHRSPSRTDQ